MKKFLALVLALVMTMSLVTISAGAEDFTDDASITYEEAVDVMSALGIVGGYADGSFNPTGTLTRGAAAKIICNMLLGTTTAEALAANEAPFKDVPTDHVFAGYIAYCVNEGIISGYADGTFRPAGTLTGYAFMKMLLGALGYDAAVEGYTGTNWSVSVAKRALNVGLNKGLKGDFVGTKALTREEACLYAFNTLKATMVKYNNSSTITVGDIVIQNNSKAEAVDTQNDAATISNDGYVQFAEEYFSGLQQSNGTGVDDLGRPSHGWSLTKGGKTTQIGHYAGTATLTYTAAVSATNMAKNLKGYTVGASIPVVTNSATGSASSTVGSTAAIAALTGNGKTVEIFISNNAITKIVVIAPALGKITSVVKTTANKSRGGYNTYYIDSTAASGRIYTSVVDADVDVDTIVTEAELAKNDMVTYYKGTNKLYIDATSKLSGVLTSVNQDGVLTIDGAAYKMSAATGAVVPTVGKKSQDYYVDALGYIIKSYTTTTTNYAYVVPGTVKQVMVANADNTFKTANRATIILPDGTFETVTTSAAWTSYAGQAITYTVNTKDEYVVGSVASGRSAAVTGLADDTIAVAPGLKANANTLYVVANFIDDDDDTNTPKVFSDVTLYTGYKNVPVYATLANSVALDTTGTADTLVDVVFIGDVAASAVETGKYVYVKGTYVNTTAGFVFDAIVAGEDATYTKSSASALAGNTLYTNVADGSIAAAVAAGQKIQNKGGLLYIDGTYTGKTIADDVAVYTINISDDSVAVGVAADLATEVDASPMTVVGGDGTRGVYVEYDAGNTKAIAVYVLFNSED